MRGSDKHTTSGNSTIHRQIYKSPSLSMDVAVCPWSGSLATQLQHVLGTPFSLLPTMKSFSSCLVGLVPVLAVAQGLALQPDIRADTNRDGVVDITGTTDSGAKTAWSSSRGAIFLPNIGDKTLRCATTDRNGNPLSNDELAACHDASGHLMFAPEYLAPLRTVPVNVPKGSTGRVYATPRAAYERVRIFFRDGSNNGTAEWKLVDQEFTFGPEQLAAGLTLGIDGRELVKDAAIWDGSVTVAFDITTPANDEGAEKTYSDAVALHMAPVLTHHHLQAVDTLVSTAGNDSSATQQQFIRWLDAARETSGIQKPLLLFNQSDDIWAQDFIEPAYASMPGPDDGKPVSIRVMLRSAQSTRTGGRQVFEQLRGMGFGAFQPPSNTGSGFGHREINSYGNLETIPPYTSKSGKAYKAGRIIMGKHYDKKPAAALLNFLEGQRVQTPLLLETGWLLIGHVDEFVQFLPYDNELGFTIGIADTTSALNLYKKLAEEGHGKTLAISFEDKIESGVPLEPGMGASVSEMLANSTFLAVNAYAQRHIDANLETLLSEIPLDRSQVIQVPTLFRGSDFVIPSGDSGLPAHTDVVMRDEWLTMAFNPAAINGIVLGKHYVAAKQYGPVVDGVDLLAAEVDKAYAKAGMKVLYVDDFQSHHLFAGEVHCGSNTLRQTDMVWWE